MKFYNWIKMFFSIICQIVSMLYLCPGTTECKILCLVELKTKFDFLTRKTKIIFQQNHRIDSVSVLKIKNRNCIHMTRRFEKLEIRVIDPDVLGRNIVVIITWPELEQSIVKGQITPQNWKIWAGHLRNAHPVEFLLAERLTTFLSSAILGLMGDHSRDGRWPSMAVSK